jgi:hypothetical protein
VQRLWALYLKGCAEARVTVEFNKEPQGSGWEFFGPPLVYHAQGRQQEKQAALAKLLANTAGAEIQVAEAYGYIGDVAKAFEWLDLAYDKRDPGFMWTRGNPMFKSLQNDPRWQTVLARLK